MIKRTESTPLKGTYFRLLGYLKPYWRRSLIILLLSAASAFIAVLPTQILGIAVDEIRLTDQSVQNKDTRHENEEFESFQTAVIGI